MGGDAHHAHHHPLGYKIPQASDFKLEDAPELLKLRDKLAKQGLKDPWMRNYIWMYNKKYGTPYTRMLKTFGKGVPTGIALFLVTIGVEKALGVDYEPWHHHHEEHGEGHH